MDRGYDEYIDERINRLGGKITTTRTTLPQMSSEAFPCPEDIDHPFLKLSLWKLKRCEESAQRWKNCFMSAEKKEGPIGDFIVVCALYNTIGMKNK